MQTFTPTKILHYKIQYPEVFRNGAVISTENSPKNLHQRKYHAIRYNTLKYSTTKQYILAAKIKQSL